MKNKPLGGDSDVIGQPYQSPQLAWWMVAYDLAYISFFGVQIIMAADMAYHILKGVGSAASKIATGVPSESPAFVMMECWMNTCADCNNGKYSSCDLAPKKNTCFSSWFSAT